MSQLLAFNLLLFTALGSSAIAREPAKWPVPDAAVQEKSLAVIREIYQDDYEDKAALAKKLLEKAPKTQDVADRFALLQEAKDLASETWQIGLAFVAIDAAATEYDIKALELKTDVLEQAAKRPRITTEQKIVIARATLLVIDEALVADNFNAAKKTGRLAKQLVQQTKDKDLLQLIITKGEEVGAAVQEYTDAQEAMTTLKDKPDDPEANTIVGKYLSFSKDDWEKGLPMMAKGRDEKWKSLAKKDIAGASSADEQVKIGDAWWDANVKTRAVYWYEKALPGVAGLQKDKTAKRIATVKAKETKSSNPRRNHVQDTRECNSEAYVIAKWERWGDDKILPEVTLFSNGRINGSDSSATWERKGRQLIFRWPSTRAPGEMFVDTLLLSKDGNSFTGKNNIGTIVRGTKKHNLLKQDPSNDNERQLPTGKKVSLSAPYPQKYTPQHPNDKITVQYAVIAICDQVGLQYDWNTSAANTDPIRRQWIQPQFHEISWAEAMNQILTPVGLVYELRDSSVTLKRRAL